MSKRKIAVIPARGGSKRIPRKNIINIKGKPMIAYSIESAIESNLFDKIVVSTDDDEIAEISTKYGAEIPFIRDKFYDDVSPVSTVTSYVLKRLSEERKENFDIVVQLMANCPLRNATDIKKAYENFEKGGHDFQISCVEYGWMNPWWAHQIDQNDIASPIFNKKISQQRSQDQVKLYCPTGAIWLAKVNALKTSNTFYGEDYRFFPMDWKNALDIDTLKDLEDAKNLLSDK